MMFINSEPDLYTHVYISRTLYVLDPVALCGVVCFRLCAGITEFLSDNSNGNGKYVYMCTHVRPSNAVSDV